MVKEKTSSTLLTSTTISLNRHTSMVACGSKPLVPPTFYVLALQEPSQTTPLQQNIDYNFSQRKIFKCLYGLYSIEIRKHILYEYIRHNGYWNSRRDLFYHFVMFLSANSLAFAFINNLLPVALS